jgi:hypothetical protein
MSYNPFGSFQIIKRKYGIGGSPDFESSSTIQYQTSIKTTSNKKVKENIQQKVNSIIENYNLSHPFWKHSHLKNNCFSARESSDVDDRTGVL